MLSFGNGLDREQVIRLAPADLADYLNDLERGDKLGSFFEQAVTDDTLVALFSYWAKWFTDQQRNQFETELAKVWKPAISQAKWPAGLEKRFSGDGLAYLLANLIGIQLSYRCSKGCPYCALDAVFGEPESIPFRQLENLFNGTGKILNIPAPVLYWASETSDYCDESGVEIRRYQDVHNLAIDHAEYCPGIITSNYDPEWVQFVISDKVSQGQISASKDNLDKLRALGARSDNLTNVPYQKGIGESSRRFEPENTVTPSRADGTILTSRGIYNVLCVPVSRQFPQGLIVLPIDKYGGEEPRVGDSIVDILRGGGIVKRFFYNSHPHKIFRPFSTIRSGGENYAVAIDENYRITRVALLTDEVFMAAFTEELMKKARELNLDTSLTPEEKKKKRNTLFATRADMFEANTVTTGYLRKLADLTRSYNPRFKVRVWEGCLEIPTGFGSVYVQPVSERTKAIIAGLGGMVTIRTVENSLGQEPVSMTREIALDSHHLTCG